MKIAWFLGELRLQNIPRRILKYGETVELSRNEDRSRNYLGVFHNTTA